MIFFSQHCSKKIVGHIAYLFFSSIFVLLQAQPAPTNDAPAPVVVVSYNVENYLMMPRWVNGHFRTSAGKPESEKKAVATILADLHPDIIGVMEMGDLRQVHDFERHLHDLGCDYPYSEYLQGPDVTRHLLLLSRFPFVDRHSQAIIPITVDGKPEQSLRGILDVTIALQPNYQLRLLCVHLKSKIFLAQYNQASFRAAEALYLRDYVRAILAADPKTHLLVMGDFNDTKNSKALLTLLGTPQKPEPLTALSLTDDRGETWTEYWKEADEYTRIDYMMVNQELAPAIIHEHSGVARPALWEEASDHCALFTEIVPKENPAATPAQ